jgi:hypothetical protein
MSFKHELQNQIINLIKTIFHDDTTLTCERNLLKEALEGRRISDDNLYEYYKDNPSLKRDKVKLERLKQKFLGSKKEAQHYMSTMFVNGTTSYADWAHNRNHGFFRYINLPKEGYSHLIYRLACNIKPSYVNSFVYYFLNELFDKPHRCPACGNYHKLTLYNDYYCCSSCGFHEFTFEFKIFPDSSNVLRRDKLIFYFIDKSSLKFVIRILKKFNDYFVRDTPLLTKEIFPGLGCAVEPSHEEAANVQNAKIEAALPLSFGQWISKILIDNIVKATNKHRGLVQEVYSYLMSGNMDDMGMRKEAFRRLTPFIQELSIMVINDPRVQRHIQEMDKVHQEIQHEL